MSSLFGLEKDYDLKILLETKFPKIGEIDENVMDEVMKHLQQLNNKLDVDKETNTLLNTSSNITAKNSKVLAPPPTLPCLSAINEITDLLRTLALLIISLGPEANAAIVINLIIMSLILTEIIDNSIQSIIICTYLNSIIVALKKLIVFVSGVLLLPPGPVRDALIAVIITESFNLILGPVLNLFILVLQLDGKHRKFGDRTCSNIDDCDNTVIELLERLGLLRGLITKYNLASIATLINDLVNQIDLLLSLRGTFCSFIFNLILFSVSIQIQIILTFADSVTPANANVFLIALVLFHENILPIIQSLQILTVLLVDRCRIPPSHPPRPKPNTCNPCRKYYDKPTHAEPKPTNGTAEPKTTNGAAEPKPTNGTATWKKYCCKAVNTPCHVPHNSKHHKL